MVLEKTAICLDVVVYTTCFEDLEQVTSPKRGTRKHEEPTGVCLETGHVSLVA